MFAACRSEPNAFLLTRLPVLYALIFVVRLESVRVREAELQDAHFGTMSSDGAVALSQYVNSSETSLTSSLRNVFLLDVEALCCLVTLQVSSMGS